MKSEVQPANVERLIAAYLATTPEDREAGETWYSAAHAETTHISALYGCTIETAAGLIAALSPRSTWGENVSSAYAIAQAHAAGESIPFLHTSANMTKASRILDGEDPDVVLGGAKVRAFYAAILGDHAAVTIDTWAIRAARGLTGPEAVNTPSPRQYSCLQEEYRQAADAVGVPPSAFQAVVWCRTRRLAGE